MRRGRVRAEAIPCERDRLWRIAARWAPRSRASRPNAPPGASASGQASACAYSNCSFAYAASNASIASSGLSLAAFS